MDLNRHEALELLRLCNLNDDGRLLVSGRDGNVWMGWERPTYQDLSGNQIKFDDYREIMDGFELDRTYRIATWDAPEEFTPLDEKLGLHGGREGLKASGLVIATGWQAVYDRERTVFYFTVRYYLNRMSLEASAAMTWQAAIRTRLRPNKPPGRVH